MRILKFVALPLCLSAFAASAQTTTASDQWAPVTPAASVVSDGNHAAHAGDAAARPSPFKFKEPRKTWEKEPPPPRANDQETVMGTQHAWMNGQPPVACAQTPHDPACR
ncbi:hypothetical protein [Rhodanobacter sp. DHB23]|uniref:hypothetical protein n=1 Tax=Rhodanobacter sp. DHB23 TaxID=2775923 RepID=UPI00177C0A25|nr:hypothetical protein [Rhodanobacter sp. DHB23]MBD8871540.1 hypothetical protein [Rhodanobacter sp. DHB23]